MANRKHVEIAQQGSEAWNRWCADHPAEIADFSGVDFRQQEYRTICFANFRFGDRANFSHTKFGDLPPGLLTLSNDRIKQSLAEGTSLEGSAFFVGATFGKKVDFSSAEFGKYATFRDAVFGDFANFLKATFQYWPDFSGSQFGVGAHFVCTKFLAEARFMGARFGDYAKFVDAEFSYGARFRRAVFGHYASFLRTRFGLSASFDGARFGDLANFSVEDRDRYSALEQALAGNEDRRDFSQSETRGPSRDLAFVALLEGISFRGSRFDGFASFIGRRFLGEADFSHAQFGQPPDFSNTDGHNSLNWAGVRFRFHGRIGANSFDGTAHRERRFQATTPGWTSNSSIVTSFRRLRKIAAEIHAVDTERELFVLERKAERGVLWRKEWRTPWRPLVPTVLMLFYTSLSNCGRSVFLPLAWLLGSFYGFYSWYGFLIAPGPKPSNVAQGLFTYTLAHTLPLIGASRESGIITLTKQTPYPIF